MPTYVKRGEHTTVNLWPNTLEFVPYVLTLTLTIKYTL